MAPSVAQAGEAFRPPALLDGQPWTAVGTRCPTPGRYAAIRAQVVFEMQTGVRGPSSQGNRNPQRTEALPTIVAGVLAGQKSEAMSAIGTERPIRNVRASVAIGGKAGVTRTWRKRRE
jgi:hypothetical protein